MSDREWQHAVLRDLGAAGTGLADPRPPEPAPASETPSPWYAEGVVPQPEPDQPTPAMWGRPPDTERQSTAVFRRPKRSPETTTADFPSPTRIGSPPDHGAPAQAAPAALTSPEPTMVPAPTPAPAPDPTPPPAGPPLVEAAPGLFAPVEPPTPRTAQPGPDPEPAPVPETGAEMVPYLAEIPVQTGWEQPAPAAPQPAAQLTADGLVRRNPHGDPLRRRMTRSMRKAVGASAAGDLRQQTGIAERLRIPVPSCRRIAVTSIRGGAGKTTVAALLASSIAEHRDDRVLAMDADSGLGSLPLRLGVRPPRAMSELAADAPRSFEETAGYLARTPQGLWVLSSSAAGQVSELELETFQQAAGGVSRYFSAAVIDCGAGIVARLQRGVLAAAHAQVFVTPGTVDGALSARQTLGWFVGSGYESLLSRTVVALVTHSPHADADADLGRAREVLSDGGMPVVVVPYDRHLATGTAISPERVSATVQAAAAWIAAETFARSLAGGPL